MKKTGNAYSVINVFKESMLLSLLLMYWGKTVCILLFSHFSKDKDHTTRYQELNHYKQTWKGVLLDYPENIGASITSLQNKSSAAIKSINNLSSKSITSSNYTNSYLISSFSSSSNISSESKPRSFSNGSLIFGIDDNYQKMITSNDTRRTIAITDLNI